MTTKTDQRVVVENVSEHNLGVERPLSLLLWSPKKKRPPHLSRAEINESQITETMSKWKDDGWIKVTPKAEFEKKQKAAKVARLKKKEVPKRTKPDDVDGKGKGRFEMGEELPGAKDEVTIKVGPDGKGSGGPVTDVGPPAKEPAKEPKPKGAHIVATEEKENVATVGSSADGSPDIDEPSRDDEPEEETAIIYTEEQLQAMKMKQVRAIVDDRNLDVKSTLKGDLIKAVLDSQGEVPGEESSENGEADNSSGDETAPVTPSPTED